MNLNEWAFKWGITFDAMNDLRSQFGMVYDSPVNKKGESEAAIQVKIRLEASKKKIKFFRNNVGVLLNKRGTPVRYGLANDSTQLNQKLKSSDLIGIKTIIITPNMIGHKFGQFIARETKSENWVYSATNREMAQLRFIEMINSLGGDAAFVNKEGTL